MLALLGFGIGDVAGGASTRELKPQEGASGAGIY